MAHRIQYRRDTQARWRQINPILQEGEVGYEMDTHCAKVGDGIHAWNDLEYTNSVANSNVSQQVGRSEVLVPSQKLLTESLFELAPYATSQMRLVQGRYSVDDDMRFETHRTDRVSTFGMVSADLIESISVDEASDISFMIYPYSNKGVFLREDTVYWAKRLTLKTDRTYLLVFAKGTEHNEDISPEDVIEAVHVESAKLSDKVKELKSKSDLSCTIGEIELTPYFKEGQYFDVLGRKNFTPGEEVAYRGISCITLRVKAGDYFIPTDFIGGSNLARAYAVFDVSGNRTYVADADAELTERIDIEEDGYIVFNASTTASPNFSLIGNFHLYADWGFQYTFPIMRHISQLIKPNYESLITTEVELRPFFRKNAFFNLATGRKYKPGEELTLLNGTGASGMACISIRVKAGDYFIPNNYIGGSNLGRAYALFDANGNKTFVADPNAELTERIDIEEDGYIVFNVNATTSPNFSLIGNFHLYSDWVYQYMLPILQHLGNKEANTATEAKNIKVLCFGNSFTQDSMAYVPSIIKNLAPNVNLTLCIAFWGGCSLAQHLANFSGQSVTLNGTTYNSGVYVMHKSVNGGAWETAGSIPISTFLSEDWDIITFQQNGAAAYQNWDTYYAPFIYKLHKSLYDKLSALGTSHNVKLGWLLTHGAYASLADDYLPHWQGTAQNAQKILQETGVDIVFPYGTAVQNLRTTSLKGLGDYAWHNLLADSAHLQEGIGCLCAAYANALTILKAVGYDKIGAIGDNLTIDTDFINRINTPGPNMGSGVMGMTSNNRYLAQVAATCAVKNPFVVTDLSPIETNMQ